MTGDGPAPTNARISETVDPLGRRLVLGVVTTHVPVASPTGSAPPFWVLADPEGNEACVRTWQGRD